MLEDLKLLLGLPEIIDRKLTKKLTLILNGAGQRLKFLLGGIEPPEEMNYIIIDVAIKRYNRIGSEGLASHTVEGENQAFTEDDFAEYKEDIRAFLDKQKDVRKGRMMFI